MSDVPPEAQSEASVVTPTPGPDLSDPMARFDAVLQPYVERLHLGVVTEHALAGFARVVRSAVAAALGDAPEAPAGESVDAYGDQVAAQKAARDTSEPLPPASQPEAVEMEAPPEPAPPVNVFS